MEPFHVSLRCPRPKLMAACFFRGLTVCYASYRYLSPPSFRRGEKKDVPQLQLVTSDWLENRSRRRTKYKSRIMYCSFLFIIKKIDSTKSIVQPTMRQDFIKFDYTPSVLLRMNRENFRSH